MKQYEIKLVNGEKLNIEADGYEVDKNDAYEFYEFGEPCPSPGIITLSIPRSNILWVARAGKVK